MKDKPDRLYRYQPLTAYSLAALVNETIWLSKPACFNDPFDCALTLAREKFHESLQQAVSEVVSRAEQSGEKIEHPDTVMPGDIQAFEAFRGRVREMVQTIGVCCFAARPDSLLMWSHYPDHHRGFCIQYDSSEGTLHL